MIIDEYIFKFLAELEAMDEAEGENTIFNVFYKRDDTTGAITIGINAGDWLSDEIQELVETFEKKNPKVEVIWEGELSEDGEQGVFLDRGFINLTQRVAAMKQGAKMLDEKKKKTAVIKLYDIKDSDGWAEIGHDLGFSAAKIRKIFHHSEYANLEIIVDEDLNIVGGRIVPFN